MDARYFVSTWGKTITWTALGVVASLIALGCDKPTKAKASDTSPVTPAGVDATETSSAETAQAPKAPASATSTGEKSYKEEAFHLSIEAPTRLETGKKLEFKVILKAQSGYKVNDEYPLKFKFAEMKGVSPDKPIVRKDEAKLEKKQAVLPLSVVIDKPGKTQVGGKLSFSVCTDDRCLIEKRDLLIEVNASVPAG